MSRLTKIEGEFHGVKFEVKATPLNVEEIQEESQNMIRGWYKENEPDIAEKLERDDLEIDDFDQEDIKALSAWKKDKEFRSNYLKHKAESAMDFKGRLPDGIWESDTIELSTIQEAWDFFCGNVKVPQNGLQVQ